MPPPVLFIITLPFKEPILTLYFTTIGSLKASINEKKCKHTHNDLGIDIIFSNITFILFTLNDS